MRSLGNSIVLLLSSLSSLVKVLKLGRRKLGDRLWKSPIGVGIRESVENLELLEKSSGNNRKAFHSLYTLYHARSLFQIIDVTRLFVPESADRQTVLSCEMRAVERRSVISTRERTNLLFLLFPLPSFLLTRKYSKLHKHDSDRITTIPSIRINADWKEGVGSQTNDFGTSSRNDRCLESSSSFSIG